MRQLVAALSCPASHGCATSTRTPPLSNRPSGANAALIAVCAGLLEMQESGRTGNVLEAYHWQGE